MSVPRIRIDLGGGLTDCELPFNWPDIKFEALFTNEFPSASLGAIVFEFRGQIAIQINNYLATSQYAYSEGIPLEVAFGNPIVAFPVILNTGDASCSFDAEIVKCPIKRVASIDWFNDTMKSVTYQLLDDLGIVGNPGSGAKYISKQVPYVVTVPTDIPQAVMLIMQEYALINQIIQATTTTTNIYTKEIDDIISLIDVYSDYLDAFAIAGDIIIMIAYTAYDAVLIIAAIGNIEMLLSQFGLLKKYKYAFTVNDLINSAVDYVNSLGVVAPFKFNSTIFADPTSPYYNTTIMPRKSLKEHSFDDGIVKLLMGGGALTRGSEIGVPNTYGYFDYDTSRLLEQINQVFNSKGTMLGNTYNIEELHHFDSGPNSIGLFTLPNVDNPGYNKNWPAPPNTNWSEREWYYRIAFAIDTQDERTTLDFTGTSCSVLIQPKLIKTAINLLSPGSKDITFPFSLAKRKEYLSVIELVVNDILASVAPVYNVLADIYNTIVSIVGGSPLPAMPTNPLEGLIGCMEVSSDTWSEQKIFIGTETGSPLLEIGGTILQGTPNSIEWQIAPNNGRNKNGIWVNPNAGSGTEYPGEGYMSSYALMQQFHGKNLLSRGNQWLIYKNKRFPMDSNIFNQVLNYNVFTTADGKYGKFDSIKLKISEDMAQDVNYRVNQIYWPSSNFYETISIDGN